MRAIRALIGSVLLCVAVQARGQSVAFLVPDAFAAPVGGDLTLSVQRQSASGIAPAPWPANLRWFFVRVCGTQENRDQQGPSWRLAKAGVTMIGLDIIPTITTFPADQFAQYIAGVNSVRAPGTRARAGEVRVRRFEAAKTLVTAQAEGEPGYDPPTATSKAGQQAEIRPLFDPTTAAPGSDVPLRAFAAGDSREGCKVIATHIASGRRETITTDAKGIGLLRNIQPGEWRVEFAYAVQLTNDPQADWNLWTTTLTFQVQEVPQ